MDPTLSLWILSTIILGTIALLGIAWMVVTFLISRIKRDFVKKLLEISRKKRNINFEEALKKTLIGPIRGSVFFVTSTCLIAYCLAIMLYVGVTSSAPNMLIGIAVGWAIFGLVNFARYARGCVFKLTIAELADPSDELLKQALLKAFKKFIGL